MAILPGEKLQRRITVGVTALMIVGICMVFALMQGQKDAAPKGQTEPQITSTPAPQGPLSGVTILVDPATGATMAVQSAGTAASGRRS